MSPSQNYSTLVNRVDALVQSISDREQLMAASRSQIDTLQQETRRALEEKLKTLEDKISKSLSDELKVTSDYTKDLYSRFERMVWIGLVSLAGVSIFIGYQTFSSIPDKINSEIARISTDQKQRLDKVYADLTSSSTQRDLLLKNDDANLTARMNQLVKRLDEIENDANRRAGEKVDRIATTYDGRFHEFQVDSYLQIARGQSGSSDVVSLLVQEFPSADASRKSRIAAVLADNDIPQNLIPGLKIAAETWAPQDEAAEITRFQLLIRHRSEQGRTEILERMKRALQQNDYDTVVRLIQYPYQLFSAGSDSVRSPGLAASDTPDFIRRNSPRRRGPADGRSIILDYIPIFRLAIDSPAASRVLPMILEMATVANVHDSTLAVLIADGLARSEGGAVLANAVLKSIVEFDEEPRLFQNAIAYLRSNYSKLDRDFGRLDRTGSNRNRFVLYTVKNMASLRSDNQLVDATVDLISKLDSSVDEYDREILATYLQTGNAFRDGRKLILSSQKNRQQISRIQINDMSWTPVEIEKNETPLGGGVIVRVQKLSIDGSDPFDEKLGVEIALDVNGEMISLRFIGNERFFIQSRMPEDVIQIGDRSVRFALEILSQELSLMMVRE